MVLNRIFLGGVWFIIHRYFIFHTFIWRGWVGGLSQMKLTSFEKKLSHFETIPKSKIFKESSHLIFQKIPFERYQHLVERYSLPWLLKMRGSIGN
jgi:hypothetical protein